MLGAVTPLNMLAALLFLRCIEVMSSVFSQLSVIILNNVYILAEGIRE